MNKLKNNLNIKNIFGNILTITIIVFFVIFIVKLLLFDFIIGTKVYNENNIQIRYHRIINIVTIKNDSNDKIYFHYQSGKCEQNNNFDDKSCGGIKYYKKSEDYEIKAKEKFVKHVGMLNDAYIFTISNEKDLYESVEYNKHDLF